MDAFILIEKALSNAISVNRVAERRYEIRVETRSFSLGITVSFADTKLQNNKVIFVSVSNYLVSCESANFFLNNTTHNRIAETENKLYRLSSDAKGSNKPEFLNASILTAHYENLLKEIYST